jgi:predicted transcriptional regulator with HTH domain
LDKSKHFIQKGLRDFLLCKRCEQYIANNIETPFVRQWWKILPSSHSNSLLALSGLDYRLTKLMILTNLWRAHCSQKDEWKSVNLGHYADKIAQMIQNMNPGDESEFPIWGQLVVDENDKVHCDIITPFAQWHPGGQHYIYSSVHGGVDWYITMSPACKTIPTNVCLTKDGKITLVKKHILKCSSVKSFRKKK